MTVPPNMSKSYVEHGCRYSLYGEVQVVVFCGWGYKVCLQELALGLLCPVFCSQAEGAVEGVEDGGAGPGEISLALSADDGDVTPGPQRWGTPRGMCPGWCSSLMFSTNVSLITIFTDIPDRQRRTLHPSSQTFYLTFG